MGGRGRAGGGGGQMLLADGAPPRGLPREHVLAAAGLPPEGGTEWLLDLLVLSDGPAETARGREKRRVGQADGGRTCRVAQARTCREGQG
jgi:hypothetical protein